MAKQKKSLGESLVEEGIITGEELKRAQEEERRTGSRLRKVLVGMGLVAEEDMVSFLSTKLGIPRIELSNCLIDPKIIELVPDGLAKKHELIPVVKIGDRLTCAMVDPWNIYALDEVATKTNLIIEPAVATETEIKKALAEHYGAKGSIEELIKTMDKEKLGAGADKEMDLKKLEAVVREPVVIKLVNLLILKAVQEGSSDIHIEPEDDKLSIRFRVDGVLHEEPSPPKHLQSAIISRVKILANMDIAERRAAQDGRFHLKVENREIDVRASCVPTIHGENMVLRLLDLSSALKGLGELGFSNENLEKYEKLILRPHGIILVTGPTGSGKTTTLYASLNKINSVDKNIITIEDPVEYRLAGVRQTQVNPKANVTFANGLRSILRQDPNIIMVGEIRDLETAEIAVQASLTGHLVLSTVHTNDAAGAVTRLVDMGVEPFLVSSAVAGILAQRLVRALCPHCKEAYEPPDEALKNLVPPEKLEKGKVKLFRGRGCAKCLNLGYKGRIGLFELLIFEDKLRDLVTSKASLHQIKAQGVASGMVTLKEDGIQKALQGVTALEEVLRVTEEV